jgi:predicted nuclease of predicted toxin-antitoxin system
MKLLLLFDQNLSYKLLGRLNDLYPGSKHVRLENLSESDDIEIWEYAKENGFTIVTKDVDFYDIGLVKGYPPKVIWLRCGNTSTNNIERILRDNYELIKDFIVNLPKICLELYE